MIQNIFIKELIFKLSSTGKTELSQVEFNLSVMLKRGGYSFKITFERKTLS